MYITKWKKLIWKVYILYDSNYMKFWKKQNHGDSEKISNFGGLGRQRWWIGSIQRIFTAWHYSVWQYNSGGGGLVAK